MHSQRILALDWLRVVAFFLLMLYHTGMLFVGWDFHVLSPDLIPELVPLMIFMNQWRLPLLFAISGAGTAFALRKRSLPGCYGERTLRLFLPLVFGMFFVVPPQIYVERVLEGQTFDSYLAFQATVFQMLPYPDGGAFSWHHLWFVLYLFVISLVFLPALFWLTRSARGQRWLAQLRTWIAGRFLWLVMPAAMLTAIYWGLDLNYPETHGLFDDPAALIRYSTFFWLGFVFFGSDQIRAQLHARRHQLLLTMACAFVSQRLLIGFRTHFDEATLFLLYFPLRGVYAWCMILALFGYAQHFLSFSNRFLRYANEAVYPFYILHQSVMLLVFYWTLSWELGALQRFAVVLLGMFSLTWLIYEALIRGSNLLRPFFGMRLLQVRRVSSIVKHAKPVA